MIIFVLLVLLNIVIIYLAFPYMAFLVHGKNKNNLIVFVAGILVYYVGIQIIPPALKAILSSVFDFFSNRIVYGFTTGIIIGIGTSLVRIEAVRFLRKNRCASRNLRACMVFGLGEGYAMGIYIFGKPGIYYIKSFFKGYLSVGVEDIVYLLNQMLELIIITLLGMALTALLQYGFTTKNKIKYLIWVIAISSFVQIQLYLIPYVLDWPMIVAEIVALLVTIEACIFGYEKIRFVEK